MKKNYLAVAMLMTAALTAPAAADQVVYFVNGKAITVKTVEKGPAAWSALAESSTGCIDSISSTRRAGELRGRPGIQLPEQPRLLDDVARQSQAGAAEFPESL